MAGEIHTYFEGSWHQGDIPVMKAGDHAAWLGSTVFDGARMFDGMIPDLRPHLERVNRSAESLMIKPTVGVDEMIEITREGLNRFAKGTPVYVRPMYWALVGNETVVQPAYGEGTGFCIALEEMPLAPPEAATTLTRTRFRRPTLDCALTNAKAGSLYPNNGRMLAEARSKGFGNALVTDIAGNVAETATANVFMVKDGEVFTPIANGTFLSGLTRKRHIANLRADGVTVHEAVLTYADFEAADEIFLSGNVNKVTPVTAFDDVSYQIGPMTKRVRELYWDWAKSDMML
ncbi:branched-chain amino acid aminotransferase [Pseudooceanicola sp. CBS1P-1]|uniref:Probable branched-chain-amino-acid aminotransferase n=1 Tax=Pseudooceanicola albus TaxID=2692189 RepID=A0A6L7G3Y5_9RHOB|nr:MULTISPECIES: branched-chain amino acid aminotransferase [Pseudooceanicola]MBT9384925.1 branched-chain amino acid aminotransferase [Pseudooceanicola endophyticus]MXN18080.1 branched-chain amino acid aminotransferase [Pseudooceanicola albus]